MRATGRLLWAVGCVALSGGACGTGPTNTTPSMAGQYEWTGMDGDRAVSTCCVRDSAGVHVEVNGGMLELGWNTGPGTYRMSVMQDYYRGDTITRTVPIESAAGTYTWDGSTLTLSGGVLTPADTAGTGPMTGGVVEGNLIVIRTATHEYEFLRLPQLPD